jgi:hypothetical protein
MVSRKRLKRFNISNKLAYTLIVIALIVGLGIGVLALSPGVAPNPGHTIDVVAPPSDCSAGQVLTWSGSSWSCTTPSAGSTDNCRFCNQGCGGQYTAERGFWVVGTGSVSVYAGRYDSTCTNWIEGGMLGARVYLCCKP